MNSVMMVEGGGGGSERREGVEWNGDAKTVDFNGGHAQKFKPYPRKLHSISLVLRPFGRSFRDGTKTSEFVDFGICQKKLVFNRVMVMFVVILILWIPAEICARVA